MKYSIRMKWAVGIFGALLLAACSSGGGGGGGGTPAAGSSLSITTTDAATGAKSTFTATPANTIFSAHTNTTENKTIIEICSDVDKDNDCSRLVIMTIDGIATNKYSLNSSTALSQIVYHDDETETGILSHYVSEAGEVEVTDDGSSSGDVKGAFTSTLACNSGCSGSIDITGSYDIVLSK